MKILWPNVFLLAVVCLTLSGCSQQQPAIPTGTVPTANNAIDPALMLLPVKVSSKWGYVNTSGQLVINPQFDYAGEFQEGRAPICASCSSHNSRWGFIDRSGKMVVTPQYFRRSDFSEGLAAVCTESKGEGTKSDPGEIYRVPEGKDSLSDAERLARQTPTSGCGYIDGDGKVAIPMQFGDARSFSEGLAAVCVGKCKHTNDGKFGFIDHSGHFVVNPQYDSVSAFKNDFAQVVLGKGHDAKTGYIDKTGKTVWQPSS